MASRYDLTNDKKWDDPAGAWAGRHEYLDMPNFLAKHSANLGLGQGWYFQTKEEDEPEDPEGDKATPRLLRTLNLWNDSYDFKSLFRTIWELNSKYGSAIVTIDLTGNPERPIEFAIANPDHINKIGKFYATPRVAEVWKEFIFDSTHFQVVEYYTTTTFKRWLHSPQDLDEVKLTVASDKLGFKLNDEYEHNLGFLPLVLFTNRPFQVFRNFPNPYYPLADGWGAENINKLIQDTLYISNKELHLNKTRLLFPVDESYKAKIKTNAVNPVEAELISFTPRPGLTQGTTPEILSANPALPAYEAYTRYLMELYLRNAGFSPPNDSTAQQTEAETLYTKSGDVETTKMKRDHFTQQVKELLNKALYMAGEINEDEFVDKELWTIVFRENVIVHENQLVDQLLTQYNSRLTSRLEIISRLRGISLPEAKVVADQIDEDYRRDQENGILADAGAFGAEGDNNPNPNGNGVTGAQKGQGGGDETNSQDGDV